MLLRRLDADELYDIHRGLEWCERELRALGPLRLRRRRAVAVLRRRWAHRWRAATGRPAVSLHAHRAWQIAAIVSASVALAAIAGESDRQPAPRSGQVHVVPATVVSPDPTPTPEPVPPPLLQATGEPMPSGQPGRRVTHRVAQAGVRRVARRLKRCWRHRRAFFDCADVAASHRPEHVAIMGLGEATFAVTATAWSGITFTLTRGADGTTVRTCTIAGMPGCPHSGRW